jgi:ABC-type transport system substrate-binding protein
MSGVSVRFVAGRSSVGTLTLGRSASRTTCEPKRPTLADMRRLFTRCVDIVMVVTMGRRVRWLLVPVVLLATCGLAYAAAGPSGRVKDGGTLRINMSLTGIQSLDPAIDYEFFGGQVLTATCVRLLSYPDKSGPAGAVLIPEAATSLPNVSNGGRTFTFTVRQGLRFNTGEPVTAQGFAHAFARVLSPKLASPGAHFAEDIVGAKAVLAGKATSPSGIKVRGNRISFTLVRPSPDFIARSSLFFFCAVPENLPVEKGGVKLPPMAGPYFIKSYEPGKTVLLEKNPNYGGKRKRHVDTIAINLNTDLDTSFLQVSRGEVDYDVTGIPPAQAASLAKRYGVNKRRFWVYPTVGVSYVALNTRRAPFNDLSVRQAVNYAIDRTGVTAQAGVLAGTVTDQVLPPNMPGYRNARIYPFRPNVAKAKKLMAGRTFSVNLLTSTGPPVEPQAAVIQANLKQIGIDVKVKPLTFSTLLTAIGPKQPYDMVLIGWGADYVDPYDFLNILLDGKVITPQNNQNLALLNDPVFNRRMRQAALLVGDARYLTYGKIDVDLMRQKAPWVSLNAPNARMYVSSRVGCFSMPPQYASMDLATACLK